MHSDREYEVGSAPSYPVYPGLVKRFMDRIFRSGKWYPMDPLFTPVEA
jgi:hypothetical protein